VLLQVQDQVALLVMMPQGTYRRQGVLRAIALSSGEGDAPEAATGGATVARNPWSSTLPGNDSDIRGICRISGEVLGLARFNLP
jgi:hypothetical protein